MARLRKSFANVVAAFVVALHLILLPALYYGLGYVVRKSHEDLFIEHARTFAPSPGRITYFHPPGGLGIRVDSAAYQGYVIPPYYDSLVGKLIVHGRTRTEALMRLRRALDEFIVEGVETTLPLFRALVRNSDVQNGQYDIHWLEDFLKNEPAATA